MLEFLKSTTRRFTLRTFASTTDSYRRGTVFARINGFFRRRVIQFNSSQYLLPLTQHPFKRISESDKWNQADSVYEYEYEKNDPDFLAATNKVAMIYQLIEGRINKDQKIFDVGCNSGFALGLFHDYGFTHLYGVDPVPAAIAYAQQHRSFLADTVKLGFFGPKEFDVTADLVMFIDSADRVPYKARLFEAIERCSLEYVVIGTGELVENFPRNWVYEMSRKGFICLEKKVVDSYGKPVGTNGIQEVPLDFWSLFLFRRIEPRNVRPSF